MCKLRESYRSYARWITLRVISLLVNCFPICCSQLPFVKVTNSFSFRDSIGRQTPDSIRWPRIISDLCFRLWIHVRKYAHPVYTGNIPPRFRRSRFESHEQNCCMDKIVRPRNGRFTLRKADTMGFDKISRPSDSRYRREPKKIRAISQSKEGNKNSGDISCVRFSIDSAASWPLIPIHR